MIQKYTSIACLALLVPLIANGAEELKRLRLRDSVLIKNNGFHHQRELEKDDLPSAIREEGKTLDDSYCMASTERTGLRIGETSEKFFESCMSSSVEPGRKNKARERIDDNGKNGRPFFSYRHYGTGRRDDNSIPSVGSSMSEKLFQGDRQVGSYIQSAMSIGRKKGARERTNGAKGGKTSFSYRNYDSGRRGDNSIPSIALSKSEKLFQGDRQVGLSMQSGKGTGRRNDTRERTDDGKTGKQASSNGSRDTGRRGDDGISAVTSSKSAKLFQGERQVGLSMQSNNSAGQQNNAGMGTNGANSAKKASSNGREDTGRKGDDPLLSIAMSKSEKQYQDDRQGGLSLPLNKQDRQAKAWRLFNGASKSEKGSIAESAGSF
ncbi:hypothetical protein ACHAXS_007092 [Conticribra weissflogii]